ncbi:MAG: beta-propeller domain-containing protein, partial [Candidatus Hadarchaeales archaeon]
MKEWVMPGIFMLTICMSFVAVACGAESIGILIATAVPVTSWYLVEGRKAGGRWLMCGMVITIAAITPALLPVTNVNLVASDIDENSLVASDIDENSLVASDIDENRWSLLKRFSSYGELENFVRMNTTISSLSCPAVVYRNMWRGPLTAQFSTNAMEALAVNNAPASKGGNFEFRISYDTVTIKTDYSTTNIQVEGVDEADIVKTDGKYLYVVSKNSIIIILAYPPEQAKIVSKI